MNVHRRRLEEISNERVIEIFVNKKGRRFELDSKSGCNMFYLLFAQLSIKNYFIHKARKWVGKYDLDYHMDNLKELYTSISTLAQKLVLTFLNNEFISKIRNSTPFGRKIRKQFRLKNHKSKIFA